MKLKQSCVDNGLLRRRRKNKGFEEKKKVPSEPHRLKNKREEGRSSDGGSGGRSQKTGLKDPDEETGGTTKMPLYERRGGCVKKGEDGKSTPPEPITRLGRDEETKAHRTASRRERGNPQGGKVG